MSETITIALDGMGGDSGVEAVIPGARVEKNIESRVYHVG